MTIVQKQEISHGRAKRRQRATEVRTRGMQLFRRTGTEVLQRLLRDPRRRRDDIFAGDCGLQMRPRRLSAVIIGGGRNNNSYTRWPT